MSDTQLHDNRLESKLPDTDELSVSADSALDPDFVPFAVLAKRKRRIRLLIVLTVLAVLMTGFLIINAQCNLYDRTMRNLDFDYRSGETINEETITDTGDRAATLAAQLDGKSIRCEAACYTFTTDGFLLNGVECVDMQSANGSSSYTVRTGVQDWLFTHTEQYTEMQPDLQLCFFAVADTQDTTAMLYSAYQTVVGSDHLTCEVWLCSEIAAQTYYTCYRYYDSTQLVGVRILCNNDDLIRVYDIQSITY